MDPDEESRDERVQAAGTGHLKKKWDNYCIGEPLIQRRRPFYSSGDRAIRESDS